MEIPRTAYAKTGDVHIAYQIVGDGPVDLVFIPGWWSHVELLWEGPIGEVVSGLARFSRVMVYDRRGCGLSDPVSLDALPTLEDLVDEAMSVMDAAGSEQAVLVGNWEGGTVAMMAAATFPERVKAVVAIDSYARFARADDHPFGMPEGAYERVLAGLREAWGTGGTALWLTPSRAGDQSFLDWFARYERQSISPAVAVAMGRVNFQIDARPILAAIGVPTLIIQRAGDRWVRKEHGRYLGEHIPDATYIELPGSDSSAIGDDQDAILDHIEEFVTGQPASRVPDRVLATVMFTDIVDSTGTAARLGDQAWTTLLSRHEATVRRLLGRYSGREIKSLGDGFLATFDGPARAIRCATAIRDAVRGLGIEIRAGLHTGECEIRGEDIGGIAVHIARRVEEMAHPGHVFVTGTVRDLVAGSGLSFEDEGSTSLKGLPDEWRLFRVSG